MNPDKDKGWLAVEMCKICETTECNYPQKICDCDCHLPEGKPSWIKVND